MEDVFVDEKRREKKDWVVYAKEILEKYKDKVVCPVDVVISDGMTTKNIDMSTESVPDKWMALDIGEKTQEKFCEIIKNSKTVFLGGPMGKFEDEKFAVGSKAVLGAMTSLTQNSGGVTIVAGGDTIDATRKYSNLENYSHVSLAGGATLDFLAGKELPALKALAQ